MSLLDEWNSEISTTEQLRQSSTVQAGGAVPQDALFSLEQRAEFLCRGRGVAVAFAAASDTLFVATSRGFLVRHDVSGVTNAVAEVEVAKAADARIRRLFVDPLGLHLLVVVQAGSGVEVHHVDGTFRKARPLGKLKGVAVSSVAWGHHVEAGCLRDVVLGSEAGLLYELSIDESKKERVKQLVALREEQPAVTGLLQAPLSPDKRLVLALCNTRLNAFVGGPTLELAFAPYASGSAPFKYIELPLDVPPSQLTTLCAASAPEPSVAEGVGFYELPPPQVFALLSPSGIYYGQLDLDPTLVDEADHLVKHHLLPAAAMQPQQQGPGAPVEAPLALALTQYHFVLLYSSKVQYINRISKQVVQEVVLDRFAAPLRGSASMPLGLCRDHAAGRVAIMAGDDAYEVDTSGEDRNMWRVFMEKGDFRAALLHCRTPHQRNAVYLAQGEFLFEEGDYVAAAALFGKLTSTAPSFEELALRLMEAGEGEAVLAFLTARLDTLGCDDRAQSTMVATWLTELLLDQVNRALLNQRDPQGAAHYAQLVEQLRAFLQRYVDVLDPGTTVGLLSGYGRVEELMHYARCRGDNEALLEHLLQRGEAQKALEVLRKPSVSPELFYKFASGLVMLAPGPTVQAWIDAQPPLDPRRLLPALLQFGEAVGPGYREALKYVRFCLHRLGSTDAAIHNLAVALLSLEEDSEDALLEYMRTARDPLGQPLYDPVHALRLVRDRGRLRASVQLFCEVGMYEDAVALALTFSRPLATAIARRSEGTEGLSRKLWLAIARHIIEQGPKQAAGGQGDERIREVGELLEEAAGAVRIEDVLPLFPDFVEIGAFRDAICSSLEKYNQEIEDLRREMQAATHTAQAIREELARLDHRSAALDLSEPCARCDRPLFQPPPSSAGPSGGSMPRLYLFPTGNAFHGSCLCAEVSTLAPAQQRARVQKLVERLTKMGDGSQPATLGDVNTSHSDMQVLRQQLEGEIAAEDPFSGEVVTLNISKPFVLHDETAMAESWVV